MDIAISSGIGVIAGFIASWLFWRFLLWKKPQVEISDEIATEIDKETNSPVFIFKLKNTGPNQVVDIWFNAWLCELVDIPNGKSIHALYKFPINNSPTLTLSSRRKSDPPWGLVNEVEIATRPEIDVFNYLEQGDRAIIITCRYSDAISKSSVVQQKKYQTSSIIRGYFPLGDSRKVVRDEMASSNYRLN